MIDEVNVILLCSATFGRQSLKGANHENFSSDFLLHVKPIWGCDMRTGRKN